ncbi:POLA1, partial [Symbiodinium sp. KB8]
MSSSKKKAMQAIRELAEAKKGGVKRSSQLKFDEEELFDYVDEEEYQQKVQDRRAMQDFVVDDSACHAVGAVHAASPSHVLRSATPADGLGYVDDGEEYDADSYDEDEAEGAEEAEEDGPLGGQKRRRQLASLAGKKGVLSSMFKKSGSSSLDAVKKARATSAMQALTADADIDDLLTGGGADDALGLDGTITAAFKRARRTSRPASRKHAETSGATSRGVHFASPATEGATTSTAGAETAGSGPGTATQGSQATPSSRDRLSAALAAQAQSKEAPSKARARRKAEALQAAAAAARGAAAEGMDMSRSEEGEWFAMQASSAAAGAAGPAAPEADSDLPLYHVPGKETSQKVACLRVFWLDAYENSRRDPGVLYLFGKVLMEAGRPERSAAYASICVKVTGLERCMFVLPRTN